MHQNCEMKQVRLKLENCQRELVESRAGRRMEQAGMEKSAETQEYAAKLKAATQEHKMVGLHAVMN